MSNRTISSLFIASILSTVFLPKFSQNAEAQFVVSDPPVEVSTAAIAASTNVENTRKQIKDGLDSAAMIAARLAIQKIVNSTVQWAQSGFEGNPAYVTDPKQYFFDTADSIAGQYIEGKGLNALCSPFQAKVRIALRNAYIQEPQYQCTLTGVLNNIDAFYEDFSQGGWGGWFTMTQTTGGNPYGSFIGARAELNSALASALKLEDQQLEWNSGFLSYSPCLAHADTIEVKNGKVVTKPVTVTDKDGNTRTEQQPSIKRGKCLSRGPTQTPGSMIKSQLDKILPSGMESLISTNHVEQLIEAFATGVFKRYIFGPQGLFSAGSPVETDLPGSSAGGQTLPRPGIDIDGDGVSDVINVSADGNTGLCLYEGEYPLCTGSIEANERQPVLEKNNSEAFVNI